MMVGERVSWTEEMEQQLVSMIDEKKSITQIGLKMKIPRDKIIRRLQKLGYTKKFLTKNDYLR